MAQYQSACSATASNMYWLGGCQQHKNTNTVLVYYPVATPSPVPQDGPSYNGLGGTCDCTYSFTSSASGSNWQSAFYDFQEWWLNNSNNQDMLTVQTFASGSLQNYNNCFNYGFKNVAAKRQWHGCYSWISADACEGTSITASADQVKYLNCNISASFASLNVFLPSGTETISATIGGSVSVNPSTGIVTNTLTSEQTTSNTSWGIEYYSNNGAGYTRYSDGSTSSFTSGGSTVVDACFGDVHCGNVNAGGITNAFGGSTTNITTVDTIIGTFNDYAATQWDDMDWGEAGASGSISTMSAITDPNNYSGIGTILLGQTDYDSSGSAFFSYVQTTAYCSWNRSGTSYTWTYGWSSTLNPNNVVTTFLATGSGALTLTATNLASTILGDCEGNLLSTWQLNDNQVYPWRTDAFTSFAPLVTRREVQNNINPCNNFLPATMDNKLSLNSSSLPTGYDQMPWQDPDNFYWVWGSGGNGSGQVAISSASAHYDGSIIGKPLAYGNYGIPNGSTGYGWLDFYGLDERFCQPDPDACDPTWIGFDYAYGGTLSDMEVSVSAMPSGPQFSTFLPQGATHWTNNLQAHSLSRGAQRSCSLPTFNGEIYSVKWAETRIPVPHQDYFLCGSDRVLINQTTAQCFTTTPLVMNGMLAGLSGTTPILLYNTGATDGIYSGGSQVIVGAGPNYTLVLGTLVSALPTDYSLEVGSTYSNGIVGLVRFPDAPAICGKQGIVTSATGSNTLVTFQSPQTNLRTGDSIDLWNMNSITLSSQSVVRVDDSNFTLVSIYTGSYFYATSTGIPSLDWLDSSQKFEGRYTNWFTSYRNSTFNYIGSCNQFCLNFSPCREQVMYLSPNGETGSNSKTVWFTDSFIADGVYGSIANLNCEFWMNDLTYQTPNSCGAADNRESLQMDDGSCKTSGYPIVYYDYPPQVESVCTVPSGSPVISSSSIPAMVQPTLAGNVGYSFNLALEPWIVAQNIMNNPSCSQLNYGWMLA